MKKAISLLLSLAISAFTMDANLSIALLNQSSLLLKSDRSSCDDSIDGLRNERLFKVPSKTFFETFDVIDSAIVMDADSSVEKYSYTFNNNGNMTSRLYEDWDGSTWVNHDRFTYTYDSNGNMTSWLMEDWDGSAWVNRDRNTYAYDSNGNMTSRLMEDWVGTQWDNFYRHIYTHDSNGNMTSELVEVWAGTQWDNFYRNIYTYDSYGNMTSKLKENWDVNAWANRLRYTYTYDSNGNMTSELWEDWDVGTWVNLQLHTYTYDSNGNMTSRLFEHWWESTWERRDRYTYTYDSSENMILELWEDWDGSSWVNDLRYTYTYDSNGNVTLLFPEDWDGSAWSLSSHSHGFAFTDQFGNWYFFLRGRVDLYYFTIITAIDEENKQIHRYSLSQNYPNPFNPTTTISYSIPEQSTVNLTVFDIRGKEVIRLHDTEKPHGNYEVRWNGLDESGNQVSTGVYFCRLEAGTFSQTIKMVYLR
jgi:hypothetical protein